MFLTLFYVICSYLKMWQLQTVRTKLLQHVSSLSCVSFYKMSSSAEDFVGACSSHCTESEKACISDLLFVKDVNYGCAIKPLQHVSLSTWRTPPPHPTRLAFLPDVDSEDGARPSASGVDVGKEYLDVLIECELSSGEIENVNILPSYVRETDAWKIVAWKMKKSNLALAVHGDISQLTLLALTFMNYETPITRIMSVKFIDSPVRLNESECKALTNGNIDGSPRHCSKYINTLQTISENVLNVTHNEVKKVSDTPLEDSINKQNRSTKIISFTQEDIEPVLIEPKTIKTESKPEEIAAETSPKENDDNLSHVAIKNGSLCAKDEQKLRKSDLKLELNSKCDKDAKALNKKSKSRPSLLNESLSNDKKSKKIGKSCPSLPIVKPPNVLIYSESTVTRENITKTLRSVLDADRYAIYSTGEESKLESAGSFDTSLLVAGGSLTPRSAAALLSAFLNGACVLSLCSDFLITVLPFYQTAEVRERELVSFTYEKWKSVKLLHNVFCYQASPARRQFSAASNTHPTEYKGHGSHVIKVDVLAAEQTWHTPSLLRAIDDESGGMAVFSQVHLELDSREYLGVEATSSEKARLGVLRKILSSLGLTTAPSPAMATLSSEPAYTPAYFLGTYERKQEAVKSVAVGCLHLVPPRDDAPPATATSTPLLLHACPSNFCTLTYYQELATIEFGRLAIYSDVLTSTQTIINEKSRINGLVIIANRQTNGFGRGGTVWLSPPGCLLFSLQIISKMSENIVNSRPALVQHIAALACVLAVRKMPHLEDLNIRIKWPNDIYYGKNVKLGGIVLNTSIVGDEIIYNIGIGINLDNKIPTYSLNDIIKKYNEKLERIQKEKLIAHILNELECLLKNIQQQSSFDEFYEFYYNYWLHSEQEVTVRQEKSTDSESIQCKVIGIDKNGYLEVQGPSGSMSVQPDGNSFDMMKGLIAPKASV